MLQTMSCPRADKEFQALKHFVEAGMSVGGEEFNTPTNSILSAIWRVQIMILEELEMARIKEDMRPQ